jgi:trehalose-6-phosphate synthase
VLSEFAGASCQMPEALAVNPYSPEDMVAAMHLALSMNAHERRRRMGALRSRVALKDVHWWAAQFLHDLRHTASASPAVTPYASSVA